MTHRIMLGLLALFLLTGGLAAKSASAQTVRPPENAGVVQPEAADPATSSEIGRQRYDNHADFWRQVRDGEQGYQPSPTAGKGVMIQSAGEGWRNLRTGPYLRWSGYLLLGMIGLLALFYALRGRIRVLSGFSGYELRRFKFLERFTHWLTATSFIVLALSGLNLIFGRALLIPLIGKEAFAAITVWGKLAHNYVSFAFMLGVVLMFLLWARQNIPNRHDLVWLAKGGGFLGGHAPAKKFNAGQKLLFWAVILLGISVSLSGLQLLYPYKLPLFGSLFTVLNYLPGVELPTAISPVNEQQFADLWHGVIAVLFTAVIFGHIYIGSIGMEGGFSAMGNGRVDLNWAREHHDLWVEDLQKAEAPTR